LYTSTIYLKVVTFRTGSRRVPRPNQPKYCSCKAAGS